MPKSDAGLVRPAGKLGYSISRISVRDCQTVITMTHVVGTLWPSSAAPAGRIPSVLIEISASMRLIADDPPASPTSAVSHEALLSTYWIGRLQQPAWRLLASAWASLVSFRLSSDRKKPMKRPIQSYDTEAREAFLTDRSTQSHRSSFDPVTLILPTEDAGRPCQITITRWLSWWTELV